MAVKCLNLPSAHAEFFQGLMQELTIQMKLEECPYVCKCFGYFVDQRRVYIVMEYLVKDLESDVEERRTQQRRYTERELLGYLREVVFALQYAKAKVIARQNIAHRDVKPQNILFDTQGRLKLVDFGSGAISDGKAQKLTGTPLYMSPEQRPDFRRFQETGSLPTVSFNPYFSDIYSLAVTFMHLALLRPPLELLAAQEQRLAALAHYMSEIQGQYPELHAILYSMLAEQPSYRSGFGSVLQRLNDLLNEANDQFPVLDTGEKPNPPYPESSEPVDVSAPAYVYPDFTSQSADAAVYVSSIVDTRAPYTARIYTQCAACHASAYIDSLQDFDIHLVHSDCIKRWYFLPSRCVFCGTNSLLLKKGEQDPAFICQVCQSLAPFLSS